MEPHYAEPYQQGFSPEARRRENRSNVQIPICHPRQIPEYVCCTCYDGWDMEFETIYELYDECLLYTLIPGTKHVHDQQCFYCEQISKDCIEFVLIRRSLPDDVAHAIIYRQQNDVFHEAQNRFNSQE